MNRPYTLSLYASNPHVSLGTLGHTVVEKPHEMEASAGFDSS